LLRGDRAPTECAKAAHRTARVGSVQERTGPKNQIFGGLSQDPIVNARRERHGFCASGNAHEVHTIPFATASGMHHHWHYSKGFRWDFPAAAWIRRRSPRARSRRTRTWTTFSQGIMRALPSAQRVRALPQRPLAFTSVTNWSLPLLVSAPDIAARCQAAATHSSWRLTACLTVKFTT